MLYNIYLILFIGLVSLDVSAMNEPQVSAAPKSFWSSYLLDSVSSHIENKLSSQFVFDEPRENIQRRNNIIYFSINFSRPHENKSLNYTVTLENSNLEIRSSTFLLFDNAVIVISGEYYSYEHSDNNWDSHIEELSKIIIKNFSRKIGGE